MQQPESKYKLFKRLFSKKSNAAAAKDEVTETRTDECSEDENERAKVRKIQLSLKAKQRMINELKKLEDNPRPRYDHIARNGLFLAFLILTVYLLLNLLHTIVLFRDYPSDPLDVFRSVQCDENHNCSLRIYFDLEPPSILKLLIGISTGILGLLVSIKHFVGINSHRLLFCLTGCVSISVLWIAIRESHYANARERIL